jgi:predicted small secreted protein
VAYEENISFVLSGPNTATPGGRDVSVTAAATTGTRAAGVMADQTVANWWITGVDTSANTISLVNPNGGEVRTYSVATPEGRAQLPRIKTGDKLTAIDTSVLVVAISPKK